MSFDTKQIGSEYDDIAPDGSEVRMLCRVGRGSPLYVAAAGRI
jgi:hypothetical protein